jgi:predicted transcriptional regulator
MNNEPICVKKARELGNMDGLHVVTAWLRKCNKSLDEIAKSIDIYDKTYNLNLSAMDVATLLKDEVDLCKIAMKLHICDKSQCELHKSPIERLISDIDPNSVIINYSTGAINFKIKGRNETILLEDLIKVKSTKDGLSTSYDAKLILYMYLKTYLEPCDPNLLTPEEIEHLFNVLKENAIIIYDVSEDDIIDKIFIEYIANLRYRKIDELGNCIMSGRGFIHDKENAIYIRASDIYSYIQEHSGYGTKKILEVISPCLIKKNNSTSQVINVKHNDSRWEASRFLILSLDAVKRSYKSTLGQDLEIEYETEETIAEEFEAMARNYQSVDENEVRQDIMKSCDKEINITDLTEKIMEKYKVTEEYVEDLIDKLIDNDELYRSGMNIRSL